MSTSASATSTSAPAAGRLAAAALAGLLALAAAAPAAAYAFGKNKVHYDSFAWQVYHSRHFDLYYYPEEATLASQTVLLAEEAYERLAARLGHRVRQRIPLVLYSSHPSFQQTNVSPQLISESTGGFTDVYRSRVVLPYTGSVPDFRHVVAHELVHVFMLDMLFGGRGPEHVARSVGQFMMPPLWFIEGMAEYLSTGWDASAQLFLEDAVASDYLAPLDGHVGGFLVYKEGQAAIAYLTERFGEGILAELLREMAGRGNLERALEKRTGLNLKTLSADFLRETKERTWPRLAARGRPGDRAFRLLDHEREGRGFFVNPRFSPDGSRLAYFADKDGEVNLYLASSLDGKVLRRLVTGHRSSRLESLHPFDTGVSFDPSGERLAFSALAGGADELVIVAAADGRELRRYRGELSSLRGPAWSPDGRSIAVSGVVGGVTDLYLLDLESGRWRRLTADLADEQDPAWLDGERLVYARHPALFPELFTLATAPAPAALDTALFGRRPEALAAGDGYELWHLRLGEATSGERLSGTAGDDRRPLPLPDGGLLFTSTAAGLEELWQHAAGDSLPRRVYAPAGGVIGPSLSGDGQRLAFSSLVGGGYDVFVLENLPAQLAAPLPGLAAEADSLAYTPFAALPDSSELGHRIAALPAPGDSLTGLAGPYRTRFLVDALGRQISYDTVYGLVGSSVISFKDVLGDQEITLLLDVFGNISDSNLMAAYTRRTRRLNWRTGAYSFLSYYQTRIGSFGEYFPSDRLALEWRRGGFFSASYPFSLFMRLDADLNVLYAKREYYEGLDPWGRPIPLSDTTRDPVEKRLLAQPSLSLVYDDALFDYLGPVKGSRWALSAGYAHDLGTGEPVARWVGYLDWRRYLLGPAGHSLALRLTARGSEGVDPVYFYLGGPYDLRGYDYLEFAGTRSALASVEWRFPFINAIYLGGPLPLAWGGIGGSVFADLGGAWTGDDFRVFLPDEAPQLADLRADVGYGFRINLGGFLLLWDIAWPTDLDRLGARRSHFSIGAQF
ncbi:hypothetical protein FJ251_09125 [bacterium]|nr:hypothetical protein [bacterium]